jgi:hypothetical protein
VSNKIKVKDASEEIADEAPAILDEVVEARKDTDEIVVLGFRPDHGGSDYVVVGTWGGYDLDELVKTVRPVAFGWRNKVFHITEHATGFDRMEFEAVFSL